MVITELMERLEGIKRKYGDIEVYTYGLGGYPEDVVLCTRDFVSAGTAGATFEKRGMPKGVSPDEPVVLIGGY